jgi:flagellar biosynthetic protein FlhB
MAEQKEDRNREDLSDEPSQYKIDEFRRKGMVAQSRELSALLATAAVAVALIAFAPRFGAEMIEFMKEVFRADAASKMDFKDVSALKVTLVRSLILGSKVVLPVAGMGFLLGIVGSFLQIGAIFTVEPLTPDLNKINPFNGLSRLFSMKVVVEGIRMTIKMIVVVAVAYFLVKAQIFRAPELAHTGGLGSLLREMGQSAKVLFFSIGGVMVLFAFIDFALQRFEYSKNTHLTKEEAKQEHKEREGDPQIKARVRAVQREVARKRMMAAVKKADVIVTNPTHIAVALQYDREKMAAPKVIAKGADFVAQKIKQIAAEAGIPAVENVPLARTLYKSVKIGHYVPRNLYQAVAEVLAYVYRLKNRGF